MIFYLDFIKTTLEDYALPKKTGTTKNAPKGVVGFRNALFTSTKNCAINLPI